jgi:hypothetical protein
LGIGSGCVVPSPRFGNGLPDAGAVIDAVRRRMAIVKVVPAAPERFRLCRAGHGSPKSVDGSFASEERIDVAVVVSNDDRAD